MDFTPSQKSAIDERNCSLIISAGAGSGKTAVLTERILSRICDENDECNINDFLIVTFTNAAAKELSDRIRTKLTKRAENDGANKKIVRNIALLPLAKISTINSFCYELVRENFQKLGLSASVRIADEAEMAVIRERIINEVLDEYFEKQGDNGAFITAFEIFSSAKNDKGFVKVLLDLSSKLKSLADPDAFCKNVLEEYEEIVKSEEFFDTAFGKRVKERTLGRASDVRGVLEKLISLCAEYPALVKSYLPALECERDFVRSVEEACEKGYESVKSAIENAEKVSLKAVRNFEDAYICDLVKQGKNEICKDFRDEMSHLYSCTPDSVRLAGEDTGAVLEKLFEIVKAFDKRVDEKKRELSVIEFSDAERYALTLLTESIYPLKVSPLAKKLRESFKEVYIDEYQDVSPLQDMIFKAISRHTQGGEECSRFMVGDVKQSIYRFRGASSDIFMSYRDTFSDLESENAPKKRIFMSDNFRCSQSVIGLTNLVFERLMGKVYSDGDRLNFARVENERVLDKTSLCLFSYDKDESGNVSRTEIEGAIICDKIKKIVGNPEYTNSDGKMYDYGDIGILARSKASLKVFENILYSCGIPVVSEVGESFYDKREIVLCLDMLNSVDNPERDIYLAGFMRSFAGGFSDDELAIIKNFYRNMSLYRSVVNFSQSKREEYSALCDKCAHFVEKLRELRLYSRGKSADKLVWKIFTDMDLLNRCCSELFGNDKKGTRKNLLKLYSMARDFSKTSFRGAGAFVEYVNGSIQNSDVKSERDSLKNGVRLMTIHASKGLEFPVCFVADLSKRFNKSDETARLVFSERNGFATSLCDTEYVKSVNSSTSLVNFDTPFRSAVKSGIDKELVDEEIRILYVALTRARDRLIMTGSFSKKVENSMKEALADGSFNNYSDSSSYLSLILACISNDAVSDVYYNAASYDYLPTESLFDKYLECEYMSPRTAFECYEKTLAETTEQKQESLDEEEYDEKLLEELERVSDVDLSYSHLSSKITVSQLKKGLIDEEIVRDTAKLEQKIDKEEPVPAFISGQVSADGAERGTAMHMFMQFCDFGACENTDCKDEAKRLCDMGFITERQTEILDYEKLSQFFKSDFYFMLKKSKKIYREQRFNLWTDAFDEEKKFALADGVLVQGVIDIFFENDDGTYSVADFKTDRVFGENAEKTLVERHAKQLSYYKRAVEEITGKTVENVYIFSFSLMREIKVD